MAVQLLRYSLIGIREQLLALLCRTAAWPKAAITPSNSVMRHNPAYGIMSLMRISARPIVTAGRHVSKVAPSADFRASSRPWQNAQEAHPGNAPTLRWVRGDYIQL